MTLPPSQTISSSSLTTTTCLMPNRLTRPSPFCSSTCHRRCTWSSPPVRIHRCPLARLRARGHLTELRAADLRFTPSEAAAFLNQVMGLNLSAEDIAALETRTEGWIAGLQLAALSLQGHQDAASFIRSFTGSHHFVLDYLVEEVLEQQPESVQTFLLRTSILDRLCGPLCDAVLLDPSAFRARNPGISRTRQPVHRPPGQRAALVPLSPSLRGFAAAATAAEQLPRLQGMREGCERIAQPCQPLV